MTKQAAIGPKIKLHSFPTATSLAARSKGFTSHSEHVRLLFQAVSDGPSSRGVLGFGFSEGRCLEVLGILFTAWAVAAAMSARETAVLVRL